MNDFLKTTVWASSENLLKPVQNFSVNPKFFALWYKCSLVFMYLEYWVLVIWVKIIGLKGKNMTSLIYILISASKLSTGKFWNVPGERRRWRQRGRSQTLLSRILLDILWSFSFYLLESLAKLPRVGSVFSCIWRYRVKELVRINVAQTNWSLKQGRFRLHFLLEVERMHRKTTWF